MLVGTRMGEGWLGCLQKLRSTVRVFMVFGCENMNVLVYKNRATLRRSGQFPNVRPNVATFKSTSRCLGQRCDIRANVVMLDPNS